jgi:predicted nucleic acid-binding protein
MSPATIVDTDILIDAAREVEDALRCLADLEASGVLAISSITQMEIIVGCRNKAELRNAERFLRRFEVYRLTEAASDVAVDLVRRYRLSHGLRIPDALIAATAIAHVEPLISKNQSDYSFIEGLHLLPYPVLPPH